MNLGYLGTIYESVARVATLISSVEIPLVNPWLQNHGNERVQRNSKPAG